MAASFRDAKRTIHRLSHRNENESRRSAIEKRIPAVYPPQQSGDRVRGATTNVHVSITTWMERTADALFNKVHVYRAALLRLTLAMRHRCKMPPRSFSRSADARALVAHITSAGAFYASVTRYRSWHFASERSISIVLTYLILITPLDTYKRSLDWQCDYREYLVCSIFLTFTFFIIHVKKRAIVDKNARALFVVII